jgi:hypothetical protein
MKKLPNYRYAEQPALRKVKAICDHCGKKQTAQEKNYSLNYAKCVRCNKEGSLTEIKN